MGFAQRQFILGIHYVCHAMLLHVFQKDVGDKLITGCGHMDIEK